MGRNYGEGLALDPVTTFVRNLDGDYYTVREVADSLGISITSLRKYISDGIEGMSPSSGVMVGKMKVYLYTKDDIDRITKIMGKRKTILKFKDLKPKNVYGGRPRIYTHEENRIRGKLFSRKNYWSKKKIMLEKAGKTEELSEAVRMIKELDKEIKKTTKTQEPVK